MSKRILILTLLFFPACHSKPAIILPAEKSPPPPAEKLGPEDSTADTLPQDRDSVAISLLDQVNETSSKKDETITTNQAVNNLPEDNHPALAVSPEAQELYQNATHDFLLGKYDKCLEALNKATSISSNYPAAYLLLGKTLLQKSVGGHDKVQLEAAYQMIEMAYQQDQDNSEAKQLLELFRTGG